MTAAINTCPGCSNSMVPVKIKNSRLGFVDAFRQIFMRRYTVTFQCISGCRSLHDRVTVSTPIPPSSGIPSVEVHADDTDEVPALPVPVVSSAEIHTDDADEAPAPPAEVETLRARVAQLEARVFQSMLENIFLAESGSRGFAVVSEEVARMRISTERARARPRPSFPSPAPEPTVSESRLKELHKRLKVIRMNSVRVRAAYIPLPASPVNPSPTREAGFEDVLPPPVTRIPLPALPVNPSPKRETSFEDVLPPPASRLTKFQRRLWVIRTHSESVRAARIPLPASPVSPSPKGEAGFEVALPPPVSRLTGLRRSLAVTRTDLERVRVACTIPLPVSPVNSSPRGGAGFEEALLSPA